MCACGIGVFTFSVAAAVAVADFASGGPAAAADLAAATAV